jgi:hypothetical protein
MTPDSPAVAAAAVEEQVVGTQIEGLEEELALLRQKILFSLELYHFLSRSMIHQTLGTATTTRLWGPILDRLIEEGLVACTTLTAKTPLDRNQTFSVYHLAIRPYPQTADITVAPARSNAALEEDIQESVAAQQRRAS